jgi:hypothetical protein
LLCLREKNGKDNHADGDGSGCRTAGKGIFTWKSGNGKRASRGRAEAKQIDIKKAADCDENDLEY